MPIAYDELLRRLFAARRAGVEWGTERVRAVLDRLGGPDRAIGAVVHVGGTNGKGSTSAMIASIAAAAGARCGIYSSPHLTSLRERARVIDARGPRGADELAGEGAWCAAAERVWAVGGDALTFFEQVTAIGLVVLAEARLDVCVLEVGLGGRLDATNAVDAPVAVITGVAMDHQEYLGDTLRAIAGEKAGIWKRGQRAVIGASGETEAVPWLADAARAAGVHSLTIVSETDVDAVPGGLGLAGAHQRANAAAALAAIGALGELGVVRADAGARARGLAEVRHPGRLEEVALGPRTVLDGAHNPHGARALAAWLAAQPERPRALVLAISADKDAPAMIDALAPHVEQVIATRYAQPRSLEPEALRALVEARAAALGRPLAIDDAAGVDDALARARDGGAALVVIAGSLFAVGEARATMIGGPIDPIVVSDPVGRQP
jgi:dihydrofolate synthase/folylpolyglutamate synthase